MTEKETPIVESLGVQVTPREAQLVFSAFEQIPLQGPETKELAASIQRKLIPVLELGNGVQSRQEP